MPLNDATALSESNEHSLVRDFEEEVSGDLPDHSIAERRDVTEMLEAWISGTFGIRSAS